MKVTCKLKLYGDPKWPNMAGVKLTEAAKKRLGVGRARMAIAGTADGVPFRTSAMNMGEGHCFVFTQQLQKATGKHAGDTVAFEIWQDTAPRTVAVPRDLAKALKADAAAQAAFDAMSFTHRKEYARWVEEAKKPETRARRVEKAVRMCAAKQHL
ncbi:MAG TPA: YdeI/OmpD-associated family protein [Myxococcales bacterium]|nr:YdeI/OmpD-associated family protein [Myxococcales bacterium]